VRELRAFAGDAVYSRLFERVGQSNLFPDDKDPTDRIAAELFPDLKEFQRELRLDFENYPPLGEWMKQLSNDAQDRMGEIVFVTQHAYYIIGIFIGAKLADPTGKVLDHLAQGLLRAMLAQPRYRGLPAKRAFQNPKTLDEER
jgi:hypothetical protein